MSNIIIDFQNSNNWKIQLTIAFNFIFSKDVEEERLINWKSDNIKLTSYNDADEVVNEVSESFRSRCYEKLEKSMRGTDFIFDSVQMMY